VLFNHMANAHQAAVDLFAAALDEDQPPAPAAPVAPPPWLGAYVEPQTGLSARIEAAPEGVRLRFAHVAETLAIRQESAEIEGEVRLTPTAEGLVMQRISENQISRLHPCGAATIADISGRYHCEELNADLTVTGDKGAFYGGFSGFLGAGRMELLEPIGGDLWALPCPRALDHTPPGDWTLAFHPDEKGGAASVTVGCWLARGLTYVRASD
jgi:D-aminopeptidase